MDMLQHANAFRYNTLPYYNGISKCAIYISTNTYLITIWIRPNAGDYSMVIYTENLQSACKATATFNICAGHNDFTHQSVFRDGRISHNYYVYFRNLRICCNEQKILDTLYHTITISKYVIYISTNSYGSIFWIRPNLRENSAI